MQREKIFLWIWVLMVALNGPFGQAMVYSDTPKLKLLLGDCYSPQPQASSVPITSVNGFTLTSNEKNNLAYLSRCVLPLLPGDRAKKVEIAANASWWSLRERSWMDPKDNFRFSNCSVDMGRINEDTQKELYGDVIESKKPFYDCQSKVWQVGIASVQVKNRPLRDVEASAAQLESLLTQLARQRGFSKDFVVTDEDILEWTAHLAGFDEYRFQIGQTKGRLRESWLLRNPWIGVMMVQPEVVSECFKPARPLKWCSGGSLRSIAFSGRKYPLPGTVSPAELARIVAARKGIYRRVVNDVSQFFNDNYNP